ncbi:MAG: DUF423 domain-containing protein [Chitinophagales bacterium]
MNKSFLTIGAILGALAVALGAFASHGLKSFFPAESMNIFETGVRYQFYHVFAIFTVAFLEEKFPKSRLIHWAGNCFIVGIILFSGSLYLLAALKAKDASGFEAIGIVTPIGGLLFIVGWFLLFIGVSRKK